MKLVYELNLPPFDEVILPTFTGFPSSPEAEENNDYYTMKDIGIDKILKPEYINLLGFKWNFYNHFKRSNFTSGVHTDLGPNDENDYVCAWAINWVYNGSGKIEYWNNENTIKTGMSPGAFNNRSVGSAQRFKVLKTEPDYVYENKQNSVYLINATIPHRVICGPNRYVFSYRARSGWKLKWEEVVNKFLPIIKNY